MSTTEEYASLKAYAYKQMTSRIRKDQGFHFFVVDDQAIKEIKKTNLLSQNKTLVVTG